MKPCPKCNADGIFEMIGHFRFYRCPSCGYSIIAKHYRAKLAECKKIIGRCRLYLIGPLKELSN